jgi:hypothetical protein
MADSIALRRFCQITRDGVVPHPTTLLAGVHCGWLGA